jgi:putative nucleotidyltransferase with HDIG domain
MVAGVATCCFSLKEIRTRIKLLQVSTLAAMVVFVTAVSLNILAGRPPTIAVLSDAGLHAGVTLVVGMIIQSLLPLIEKVFRIATSMTLLDYSDANQPLLKRLAMEAPGTYSHSLLIGSVAEAAAEAIGRNGLLCRVGAYYHDIGKINKPGYFVENELGTTSRHRELSPAMSQLIIIGHVKDGVEMAKEYGLPAVLRQFIETHHGSTLVEYFYNEAKKRYEEEAQGPANGKKPIRSAPPSESEFRYAGPKPRTKEVHNIAMKRLQDGQFDECDLTLRELSQIEVSISKTLVAHHHGRIAYPKPIDLPEGATPQKEQDAREHVEPTPESQPEQARHKR